MKIAENSMVPFDFEGLQMVDYTSETNGSASASSGFAVQSRPPTQGNVGVKTAKALSVPFTVRLRR